ncbi:fibroblast growth factor receptor-like 1 isoform X2 [Ylistrum balloti]|uniref:fibroblast growth factor receptor-like 1 isoform X2 n=1 Tax=Ylistrum balloti TaxID=509963 RepID=UPI002905B469|nr:fibroblast growth factor receptor-like 1 isoform X2 [Ylistrum balloti]
MELHRLLCRYYILFFWIILDCSLSIGLSRKKASFKKAAGRTVRRQAITEFVPVGRRNITVHKGETVVLKCTIKNLGPREVVWRKVSEDFPLSIGTHMYAPVDEMSVDFKRAGKYRTRWDLIIKRTKPSHSGKYECQIVSKELKTYHINLVVLSTEKPIVTGEERSSFEEPPNRAAIEITGAVFINIYQKLNLTCNATGMTRAPAAVDWFHDGHIINSSDKKYANRLMILNKVPEVPGRSLISTLIIERCTDADKGSYVCRSSDLDTTSKTVHILSVEKNVAKRNDDKKDLEKDPVLQQTRARGNSGTRQLHSTSVFLVTLLISVISAIT